MSGKSASIAPAFLAGILLTLAGAGCKSFSERSGFEAPSVPTEKRKVPLPDYTISPPDVLLIDAVRLVPKPPYKIAPLDTLVIQVTVLGVKEEGKVEHLLPGQPISGLYRVEPEGTVNLGFDYGVVPVASKTLGEAKEAIKTHLQKRFRREFDLIVELGETRAMQQIRGDHLVRQDGKVTLGTYGSVFVTGMTLEEAKLAIQAHLSAFLLEPEISVDVSGFNSSVYYLIYDLDGSGETVRRLPVTGNETVLDAVGEVYGLSGLSCRWKMWVARPDPADCSQSQILPIDWRAITRDGVTTTNYQLRPGDRVFVAVDPMITIDTRIARIASPIERVLGISLLGHSTIVGFRNNGGNNNGIGQ